MKTEPTSPPDELGAASCSPFVVPPFSPPPSPAITYVWWSWHPSYPYWSQSCWKAATIEDAQRYLTDPLTTLAVNHNKLIRHDGITLVEVQDEPCREMDVWHKIKRQMDEADCSPSLEVCTNCNNLRYIQDAGFACCSVCNPDNSFYRKNDKDLARRALDSK
jgi:hypothetical protein